MGRVAAGFRAKRNSVRLCRLELRNWCQHAELVIDFPEASIIRIAGSNNAGKSNLIRAIGRVLAQGRSEYGDATDLRYGTQEGAIRLTALTHAHTKFTISRVMKNKQSKVALEYEDQSLANADEITRMLQEWFGRPATLLQLFIAPQGKIANLLKERGRHRLTQFIEICGFKGFLEKQATLNRFIRAFPTIVDPAPLLADAEIRKNQFLQAVAAKENALNQLRSKVDLERQVVHLQEIRTLRQNAESELKRKAERLQRLEAQTTRPLPKLEQLQQKLRQGQERVRWARSCTEHQKAYVLRKGIVETQTALELNPEDKTDYGQLIEELSRQLQHAIARQNELQQSEQQLRQLQRELAQLEQERREKEQMLAGLDYDLVWHHLELDDLVHIQKQTFRISNQERELESLQTDQERLKSVPEPSSEILRVCQASEDKLQELASLHRHVERATVNCPLCLRDWETAARQERVQDLHSQLTAMQTDLKRADQAWKTYQSWQDAQQKLPQVEAQVQTITRSLADARRVLETHLSELHLPPAEQKRIGAIIANHQRVKAAQKIPLERIAELQQQVKAAEQIVANSSAEDQQLKELIQSANGRMRNLLQRQTAAIAYSNRRARLQQQHDSLQSQLATIEQHLEPRPPDFQSETDYQAILRDAESALSSLQIQFQEATQEWTARFEQAKDIEALRSAVAAETTRLQSLIWGAEQEQRLADLAKQLEERQRLTTELQILQQQRQTLEEQMSELQAVLERFQRQTRHLADLEAVSEFLSYDNGPLKFLTTFFGDVLAHTNLLLSDMCLPVKLHMGDDLEILVEDHNAPASSALALGGGYSNLIGIAFRIALQKMILPQVHVIILDEPSTHIDEANMELLIPFFQRLKHNLAGYGIEQCILIDHHPAWQNADLGLIQIGQGLGAGRDDKGRAFRVEQGEAVTSLNDNVNHSGAAFLRRSNSRKHLHPKSGLRPDHPLQERAVRRW